MKIGPGHKLALVLLSGALLTSACGLKPEVKDQLSQGVSAGSGSAVGGGGGGTDTGLGGEVTGGDVAAGGTDTTGGTTDTSGGTTDTSGGSTDTSGGTTSGGGTTAGGGTTSGGGTTAGGGTTSGGGTTAGGGTASGPAAPVEGPGDDGTTTGIDVKKKVVKIALHGPLTGAGVPQESFRTGTPKYWNGRTLKNGFKVEAVAIDDKYNAPDALRACNAAAKEYFLIVGGAGTDQIQACAQSQVLRRGNVPYLSAGVTEAGLGSLPNYFATSLTYRQQGPLVIKMAKDNGFFAGKWAVVITEGPNFKDARDSIVSALKSSGAQFNPGSDVFLTDKAPQNCAALSTQLRGGNYSTIYFLGQPSFFAQCVSSVGAGPTYTGVGPSFGINTVANLACAGTAGRYKGIFLHPSAGLDQAARRAPGIRFQDDIEFQIYGAMQGLERAFNLVEGKLTREKFTAALAKAEIPDGIAPGASYKSGSRFGGKAAFALKANCGNRQYATLKQYGK